MLSEYSTTTSDDRSLDGLAPGLVVEEDAPNERLRIAWRGAPPYAWLRLLAGGSLLTVVSIWAIAVYFVTQPLWALPQQKDDYVIAAVVVAFGLYFIYLLTSLAASGLAYWREFTWDAGAGEFIARQSGWLLWGHKSPTVPLAQIESLWMRLGSESAAPLPVNLIQHYQAGAPDVLLSLDLTPLRLKCRAEYLELLFAIARIVSARGYRCTENTFREQALVVWREMPAYGEDDDDLGDDDLEGEETETDEDGEADDDGDDDDSDLGDSLEILPIPQRGELPAELLTPPAPALERRPDVPRFDPEAFREKIATWKVEAWDPGTVVHISRPAEPIGLVMAAGVFGLILGGLAGWFPIWGFLHFFLVLASTDRWLLAGLSTVAGGLLLAFMVWNGTRAQNVLFDWHTRSVAWRNGNRIQQWPFEAISGLTLVTLRRESQGTESTTRRETQFAHHLKLPMR